MQTLCHCRERVSYTRDLMEGVCEKIALPPATKVALSAELPNFDCTGLKLIHLCEYLTERDVSWLILKRKSHEIL